jgi:hypothetical protein
MKPTRITRGAISGVLALLAGAGVACSSKADASSFDSAYCHNIRRSVAGDITHVDERASNPAKAHWVRYIRFMDGGLRTAPKQLRADWTAYHAVIEKQTAIVERYGYDEDRFDAEATAAERAAMDMSPRVQAGVDRIMKYEAFTCGGGQPPAARMTFKGQQPGPYCDAVKDADGRVDEVDFGDPVAVRKFLTDPDEQKLTSQDEAKLIATAPKIIAEDVEAEVDWWNSKQRPVLAKYGYDAAKLLLHGSAQDLRDLQLTDARVADHFARATAYEHEVCGL